MIALVEKATSIVFGLWNFDHYDVYWRSVLTIFYDTICRSDQISDATVIVSHQRTTLYDDHVRDEYYIMSIEILQCSDYMNWSNRMSPWWLR